MNEIECETCIKRKTKYCPSSRECYETTLKPHYQNRIMLFEENRQLRQQLQQKEDIINKIKEEIRYLESNCDISNFNAQKLRQIIDNKGGYK